MLAVEALQTGIIGGEDDLLEFKRDYFKGDKFDKGVRQLAGSLNRAAGEPVLLVFGVEDQTGKCYKTDPVDLNEWWPSVQSKFDQVSPELIRHVPILIDGITIQALAISSDRAPYVFRVSGHSPHDREIPIREATGTRSAHRDQILRMLAQQTKMPTVDTILGECRLMEFEAFGDPEEPEYLLRFDGSFRLFFDPHGSAMIPRHRFTGTVNWGGQETALSLYSRSNEMTANKRLPHEVIENSDGIYINSPSGALIRFYSDSVLGDSDLKYAEISAVIGRIRSLESISVSLNLPFAGTNRSVSVKAKLELDSSDSLERFADNGVEALAGWKIRASN
ncbi:hypothetical protein CGQ24_13890 [Arthrobacter sp. 7749]|nr:hypothetical protein CGQ24_13890 [Arthrobacter sp. 7749]